MCNFGAVCLLLEHGDLQGFRWKWQVVDCEDIHLSLHGFGRQSGSGLLILHNLHVVLLLYQAPIY
jgi:hypothetical protein